MEEPKTENKIEGPKKKSSMGVFVLIGIVIVFLYLVYSLVTFSPSFDYRGLTGNVVKEGNILFYKTSIPVIYQGGQQDYYFYLRNNPKELDKIPFNGTINFTQKVVIQSPDEYELACNGYGTIGVMQLGTFYNLLGAETRKDNSTECSPNGEYTVVNIIKGDETRIDEIGPSCYNLVVNNCETLKVSEKFLVENLIAARDYLYNGS